MKKKLFKNLKESKKIYLNIEGINNKTGLIKFLLLQKHINEY